MKSLLVVCKEPYPPIGGAAMRNWQNVQALKKFGEVGIFYIKVSYEKEEPPITPPDIDYFQFELICREAFQNKFDRIKNILEAYLNGTDQLSESYFDEEVQSSLKNALLNFHPDVVILEELWVGKYINIIEKNANFLVYDAHNIESIRYKESSLKQKDENNLFENIINNLDSYFIGLRERKIVNKVNQTWVCSNNDQSQLQRLFASAKCQVKVIPNSVNVNNYLQEETQYIKEAEKVKYPHSIIFTASFSYAPNQLAADLLINEIFPRLQQVIQDSYLFLVGSNPTPSMLKAGLEQTSIIVTGKVPSVRPYLSDCSVVVVPLLQGGGTRLKILESFAAQRPVISTTKGVEGINALDGVHLLIRDSVEEIVDGILLMWTQMDIRKKLVNSALDLVENEYSWAAVTKKMATALVEPLNSSIV